MLSISPSRVPDPPRRTTDAVAPASQTNADSTARSGIERRAAPRRPASAFPSITGLRMSPHGADALLVNISATGLLAECAERLQTGSQVTVMFEGEFTRRSVEGQVVRNLVAAMARDGRLRYHIGIQFDAPIELPAEPSAAAVAAPPLQEPVRNRW